MTSAADILEVLGSQTQEAVLPGAESAAAGACGLPQVQPGSAASELARRVWTMLEAGAVDVEDLADAVGAEPGLLASALLELELAGLVQKLPGPRYARAAVVPSS